MQNENKTLSDTLNRKEGQWDDRYSMLLAKLEGYQEEKDNPQKQVVDIETSELYVLLFLATVDYGC
jgi:hypothetical protein